MRKRVPPEKTKKTRLPCDTTLGRNLGCVWWAAGHVGWRPCATTTTQSTPCAHHTSPPPSSAAPLGTRWALPPTWRDVNIIANPGECNASAFAPSSARRRRSKRSVLAERMCRHPRRLRRLPRSARLRSGATNIAHAPPKDAAARAASGAAADVHREAVDRGAAAWRAPRSTARRREADILRSRIRGARNEWRASRRIGTEQDSEDTWTLFALFVTFCGR